MERFKFRGWDKTESEWVDIKNIRLDGNDIWYVMTQDEFEKDIDPPFFPERDQLVLMQYTGLKDRNGVEIYEGDIVTEHPGGVHFAEDDYATREVKWGEFGWSPFGDVIGHKAHDFSGNLYEYIVIGNIYEKEERT